VGFSPDVSRSLSQSEGVTWAGEPTVNLARPHGQQVGAGCWQETSCLLHWSLLRLLCVLVRKWLATPRVDNPKDSKGSGYMFYDEPWKLPTRDWRCGSSARVPALQV
jgi:hypothetical protein